MLRTAYFDSDVYCLDIVKKSLYRLSNHFSSDISLENSKIVCRLNFSDDISDAMADFYLDELKKEVLDQDLRQKIKDETEPTRNLILAHAFSKTKLIPNE